MKKTIFILASILTVASAYAFSFGNLAKSVASATSTSSQESNSAIIEQQNAMVKSYTESKEQFLKGYLYVINAMGASSLAKDAEAALKIVESNKSGTSSNTITNVSQAVDSVIEKTTADALKSAVSSNTNAIADSAKSKYTEGFTYFKTSINNQVDVAKKASDIAKQAKVVISNGTTLEKLQLASSFDPSITLAKTIGDDLSKAKSAVSEILNALKASGIDTSNLASILAK